MKKLTSIHVLKDFVTRWILAQSKLGYQSIHYQADLGTNFDHIYNDSSSGTGVFGKCIDRILLNLPGSEASRIRKNNLKSFLIACIGQHSISHRQTRIVDLACGTARYLTEIAAELETAGAEVLCVDKHHDSLKLAKSRFNAARFERAVFLQADVFELVASVAQKSNVWRPNIAILSGLLEYLMDEKAIELLRNIRSWSEPDSFLLLTNQQHNPSHKLMEKFGRTHSGRAWKLFYRSTKAALSLIEKTEFELAETITDRWKIYNTFVLRSK
jgi:SAM-dependent methyltransferase